MEVESNDFNIFNVKREVINNIEGLLEEKTVKQEKDIPEYVNVNSFSKVKIESEVPGDSQEIFQCSQCPNKYKKIQYLSIHEVVHDPQRFCTICYVTFTCKKKLGQHLNQHIRDQMKEDKKLAYSCAYCEKYFNSKRKFTLHMRVHTNERPHKCEICGEGFKQLGTLKDHYITHTKEKRYACEICNGCFTTSSSLKRHKRKMHDKGKTINCKHCDSQFLNMTAFRTHRDNVHPDVGYKRTCLLCSETFRTRNTYRKHKQLHDDQLPKGIQVCTKDYLCILCGEKSLTLKLYLEHRRIHLDYSKAELEEARQNNLFKCKFCTKQFMAKSTLFKHMDIHMEKQFKCDPCQNLYTYYGLSLHMRAAHEMLHCRVCQKVLYGRAKLYYHYQKCHPTVRKPFACSICSKQYVSRYQLNLHFQLIHEKNAVKNFKCNICGKRFLTRLIMAAHMVHVHNRKTKYKCSICEIVVDTRKEMSTHNLIHKENASKAHIFYGEKYLLPNSKVHKRFQCKMCTKIFQSRNNYKIHLASKTCRGFVEERKKKDVSHNTKCVVCTKKFATVGTLRRHMVLHSTFEYNCRFCDKKYKIIGTMRRHIQIHHPGEKAFRCDLCGKEFDRLFEYNKHKNMHTVQVESVVQIDSYADRVLAGHKTFDSSECNRIKEEPEDPSVEHFIYG